MCKMWKRAIATLMLLAMLLGFVYIPQKSQAVGSRDSSDKTVTVVAGSDFQYSNADHGIAGGQVAQMLGVIKNAGYESIDGFLFAGDYSQAFTEADTQKGLSHLQSVVSEAYPGLSDDRKLWLQGNHDPDALVDNGTLSASGAHDTSDYGVFLLNEKDYMWYNDDEATVKVTAASLKNYLGEKILQQYSKPIFIVSHLQLHYSMRTSSNGDGKYANYLFDVINEAAAQGLNIIFLFGHNHSNGWDDYLGGSAVYLEKGDPILIAQNSNTSFREETLNFTYLNAGYVGYYSGVNDGAETELSMTVFSITDEDVTISRFTRDGIHDLKSGGVTNSYRGETAYSPDTRDYTSPRTVELNIMNRVQGTVEAYLDRVDSPGELQEGVPYVISDYKDSWLHYVLTSQATPKVAGSKTHQGYLLSGTPSVDVTDLWYIKDGKLVYGSADSNQYLRITYDSSRQGQVTLGSYNASTAAYITHYSGDDFAIRGSTGYYLNRWGGGYNDTVATAYTSAGGSFWHLDRLVPAQDVTLTATPSAYSVFEGRGAVISCQVMVDGVEAEAYSLTWNSSDSSVATVSNGRVSALKAGRVTVSVTLSAVDGRSLKEPITVNIPLTVDGTDGKASVVQGAAMTVVSSLSTGVPYIITEKTTGHALTGTMLYKTSSGYKGKSGLQGLMITDSFDTSNAPVWYYDGTYLRYGSTNGKYLIYNTSSQVALGSLSQGKPFDKVTAYGSNDFNIYPSGKSSGSTNYYLNQYGGINYNVAGLYTSASYSRWQFSELLPQRTLSISVSPSDINLNTGAVWTPNVVVQVDGIEVSDYTLSWSSADDSIATVSADGLITGVGSGEAAIIAKLTVAQGRALDDVLMVRIPVQVTNSSTVSGYQSGQLQTVSSLTTGVPYVITERTTGHALTGDMLYKSSSGYKGLSGVQGLKIAAYADLTTAPVWYYDGTYLRYGSADGKYLIYNNSNQVALGSLSQGNPFDTVTVYSSADKSFNLSPSGMSTSTRTYYLNQYGGVNYNVGALYASAYHSRWQFSQLLPGRILTLSSMDSVVMIPGETVAPSASVLVNGVAASAYTLSWSSADETVATVSHEGVITGTGIGQTVITLKLTSADGRALDEPLSLEIPVEVEAGSGYTASALQEGKLTLTNTLQVGVPYLISERITGHVLTGDMAYKTDSDYKGLSGTQGLKTVSKVDLRNAPVWYYDGTYLRYGSPDGEYLIYNSANQVALGSLSEGKPFEITVYSSADKTFNLSLSSKSGSYINQLGGVNYNAAGLYSSAYYSRWQFSAVVPERLVTLNVTPAVKQLGVGRSVQLERAVSVNGDSVSEYELSWTVSDPTVARVENGVITAIGAGNVVITVTLTSAQGMALQNPVTLEIPLVVNG